MERRIKILYIITIFAILAFLGMQSYWLYSRYEYSIGECEDQLRTELLEIIEKYRQRRNELKDGRNTDIVNHSTFSLSFTRDDSVGMMEKHTKVTVLRYSAQEILGLPPDHVLTEEEKKLASEKIMNIPQEELEEGSRVFDTSDAPTDGHLWEACRKIEIENVVPFTKYGIDSMLRNAGYIAETRLSVTDSIMWDPVLIRHTSAIFPSIRLLASYSELERKIVEIECPITISAVLARMFSTLIIILTLSFLLILCLTWQFSTILKQNRLDRIRNKFVTTMIHELKRPISTLKMCVSGLENEQMLADHAMKDELVKESRGALDNLSAYFSRLRDLTFNNATQIPLNTTQFSLRNAVSEIINKIPSIPGKRVTISDDSDSDVLLTADRVHIINILTNLVENSIKYSGADVAIHISYTESGSNVEIKVRDNGDGISQADCGKIFDRFYRSRSAVESDRPGMGLGLAYVRLLSEAHGGDVTVKSVEGEGTCFTIRLPQ